MDKKIIISIVLNALVTAVVAFSGEYREFTPVLIPVFGAFILISVIGAVLIVAGKKKTGAIMVCAGCAPFVPVGMIGIRGALPILKEMRVDFWGTWKPWVIEAVTVIPLMVALSVIVSSNEAGRTAQSGGYGEVAETQADKDDSTNSALRSAAEIGDIEAVKALLDKGANVNAKDANGTTPLIKASVNLQKDTVSLLIKKGADVNEKDKRGNTALMLAIDAARTIERSGSVDVVELLISNGAEVNVKNIDNMTPLLLVAVLDMENPGGDAEKLRAVLKKAGAKN